MTSISTLAARRRESEDGFTLIELMVVVLIIAILIAIAIPTFLGARERAQDRAAQSSLRNGLTAAKTIYTDHEDYTQATTTALQAVEPSLTFQTSASAAQTEVFVSTPDNHTIYMGSYSKSGTCFWITDDAQGATATRFTKVSGACTTTVPTSWTGW